MATREAPTRDTAAEARDYKPRLKQLYVGELRGKLKDELGLSLMQVPRISKITLNMGVGEAKTDAKQLDAATDVWSFLCSQLGVEP